MAQRRYFTGYSTYNISNPSNAKKYDIDLVKRDLLNEFMTKKGERPMQPEFGSIIWEMIFEPNIQSNRDLIVNDSKRIIENEPRVDYVDMNLQEYEHGLTIDFLLNFKPENVQDSLYVEFFNELSRFGDESETITEGT